MGADREIKLAFENLLFVGLLAAMTVVGLGIWALFSSESIYRRIDRITDLARQGSTAVPDLLSKMGGLGERISRLQRHLNEISELRARRISVLSGLNAFLLANVRLRLAVVDLQGKIVSASGPLLEDRKEDQPDILGRDVGELIHPEKYGAVVSQLEQSRMIHSSNQGAFQFVPLFDSAGHLTFVVCVVGKTEVKGAAGNQPSTATGKAVARGRRILGMRGRPKRR
jgi:hypothetical protein